MNNTFFAEPNVLRETAHGTDQLSINTELFNTRRVCLFGEVNSESAQSIARQLMYLISQSDEPIIMYIDSPGGSVSSGLMIYDLMQNAPCEIHTVCIGTAASMGAVLFAAGTPGHRYIYPNAKTMIHEPLISQGVGGSASSIERISKSILETKKQINQIIAKHTGKNIKDVNRATSYDNYMNAIESVKFGLADVVVKRVI